MATDNFNGVITIEKSWVARFNDNDNKANDSNPTPHALQTVLAPVIKFLALWDKKTILRVNAPHGFLVETTLIHPRKKRVLFPCDFASGFSVLKQKEEFWELFGFFDGFGSVGSLRNRKCLALLWFCNWFFRFEAERVGSLVVLGEREERVL
ncbi:hypothetical protein AAC387_Pa11g1154 [Persea americana]